MFELASNLSGIPHSGPDGFRVTRRRLIGSAVAAGVLSASGVAGAAPAPRIVSLDYGLASTLLSLGVTPIAISEGADWSRWVREPEMPAGVIDLGSTFEVNRELLAALRPDIILTTPYLDSISDRLAAYGRLVRLSIYAEQNEGSLDASIRVTRTLAAEIGRQEEAERFLARADAFFGECRQKLARLSPTPVAVVNFLDARHVRVYGAPGLFDNVFQRIGLENAWKEGSNYWGFQTLAIEELSRIADPRAHLIALDPVPGDVLPKLARSPLWQALPFARAGRFHILQPTLMFGMVNEALRFARLVTELLEAHS